MKFRAFFILVVTVLLNSCATVDFYSKSTLSEDSKTGIEFYSAKPYLLVENNPAKDVSLRTSIIYLPDLTKPKYAKIKPGIGSSDLKLSLSNGIINSYGITTDSKVPETISALTGALTGYGTFSKEIAEAGKLIAETDEKYYNIYKDKQEAFAQAGDASDMQIADTVYIKSVLKSLSKLKSSELLMTRESDLIESTYKSLDKLQKETLSNHLTKDIPLIVKEFDNAIKKLSSLNLQSDSDDTKKFNDFLRRTILDIQSAKYLLVEKKNIKSSYKLYEIRINENNTELIPVNLPYELF